MRVRYLVLTSALACGGKAKSPIVVPPLDAGSDGGPSRPTTSAPPSGLPAMATMPPPGVAGSKKAKRRSDATMTSCSTGAKAQAKDPADHVKRLAERCATKMTPVTGLLRGQQADKEASQEQKFRAEANRCYRVYFASDEAAKEAVVVLRDSAGDIIAEAPGPAVPADGVVCFTSADEVSLLVGIGIGKGAWAAQVFSD